MSTTPAGPQHRSLPAKPLPAAETSRRHLFRLQSDAMRIRPVFAAAALLAVLFVVDTFGESVVQAVSAAPRIHPTTVSIGDSVRYVHNSLTYKVIAVDLETALMQRGDDVIFADRTDLLVAR